VSVAVATTVQPSPKALAVWAVIGVRPPKSHDSLEEAVPAWHATTQPPVTRWRGDALTSTVKLV
jgi:hypothetical protein